MVYPIFLKNTLLNMADVFSTTTCQVPLHAYMANSVARCTKLAGKRMVKSKEQHAAIENTLIRTYKCIHYAYWSMDFVGLLYSSVALKKRLSIQC